ncbi:MAG: hypothetical protein FJ104_11970, partial [Deltaproteobacteria bacterium]|nr:hypothetical protein [Deltaproteobacteria bacterium]
MTEAADRARLEGLPRAQLIAEGRRRGVQRPEVMTRLELLDEILRLATPDAADRRRLRGWLGVARDLIASAVERGLHLPDAARMIRGEVRFDASPEPGRHVATVTLAEIYAAQGHGPRAVGILEQVLAREPDHEVARALLDRVREEVRAGA